MNEYRGLMKELMYWKCDNPREAPCCQFLKFNDSFPYICLCLLVKGHASDVTTDVTLTKTQWKAW